MSKKSTRIYLNPLLAMSFAIVAVTGVLMLFHVGGVIHPLHEWMSVLFLILCVVHLALNWKALAAFLKRGPSLVSLVLIVMLSVGLMLLGGGEGERGPHGPTAENTAAYVEVAGAGQ